MTWNGDISRMGKLKDRLADLAGVPSRVAREVSGEIAELLQAEFDAGADPYGSPWTQLADSTIDRGRFPPPLTDTRAMRDSIRVAPLQSAGIGITIDHPAAPHQAGWRGPQGSGPKRPILPARGELPRSWQKVIENAIEVDVDRIRRRA